MPITRKIIEINEDLCTGCGQCIVDCAEGALTRVDGKARVLSDNLCDGLGACIGGCPTGALRIIEREAEAFDEDAVARRHHSRLSNAAGHPPARQEQRCPGARPLASAAAGEQPWPVKLRLLPERAPFLRGAHLLLTADCAPVVDGVFLQRREGCVVCTVCPKFEAMPEAVAKLQRLAGEAGCTRVTTLRMEVPCCTGLKNLGNAAAKAAQCPVEHQCLSRRG